MKLLTEQQIKEHNENLLEIQKKLRDSTYKLNDIRLVMEDRQRDEDIKMGLDVREIVHSQLSMICEFYKVFIV